MTSSLMQSLGGHTPEQWAHDLLVKCAFPVTQPNVQAVVSWEYAESGGGGGMFNPLNTTLHWPGSGPIGGDPNQNGGNPVQDYASYQDGIDANAQALLEPQYYSHVIAALQAGTDAQAVIDAVVTSPWGTKHIVLVNVAPVAPSPPSGGEMMLVASPHKPSIVGRSPAALWDPTHPNQVILTNGASIAGDQPVPAFGVRVWRPPVNVGCTGVGIFARLDGTGIVLQDNKTDTYIGLWS